MEAIMQKVPWNKGRLTGQKRPLKPRDVWAIELSPNFGDGLKDQAAT
jgi:hypothetical protein